MGPAGVAAAAQVFVSDLEALSVTADDAHHLQHVLRLRPGETVVASDGRGGWRTCRVVAPGPGGGAGPLEADGPVHHEPRHGRLLTVAFVPVKGGRPEWVVQKLTEMGVDRIVAVSSQRAVVRWTGERRTGALNRLRRVAREAAAQSRQAWLPEVEAADGVDALASGLAPVAVALAQPGGPAPGATLSAVAVGPEGGWDPSEVDGTYPLVGLGPTVLRAETAAVAAGVLLCGLRAGLVRPAT